MYKIYATFVQMQEKEEHGTGSPEVCVTGREGFLWRRVVFRADSGESSRPRVSDSERSALDGATMFLSPLTKAQETSSQRSWRDKCLKTRRKAL